MLIDWFTVIAQIVNFLILMWLLKRFLYKPILKAIDERDKKIKAQIQDAEDKMTEAEKEKEEFHKKNDEFEQQRKSLLNKATEEVSVTRKQLLDDARREAKALRSRLEQSLREDQQSLSLEIIQRTQKEIFAIARKVLADLASTSLEEHIANVFIQHLKNIKGDEKGQLVAALKTIPNTAIIRSVFELPKAQREEIENAVKEIVAGNIQLQFEISEEQISGIELTAGGYKVAWSIADYLAELEKKIFSQSYADETQSHAE